MASESDRSSYTDHLTRPAHDPEAAERRRRCAADRADATVRPDHDAPGRADLVVGMSTEDAHACWATADALARAAQAAGDPRPLGVLRADAVRDRILRPTGQDPAISAQVTVLAPLDALTQAARQPSPDCEPGEDLDTYAGDDLDTSANVAAATAGSGTRATFGILGRGAGRAAVGEVNGAPITAAHLRALLESVDALCPGGLQPPTGGSLRYALTDPDGALRGVLSHRELRRLTARGCPQHGPGAGCGCGLVDRPPEVDRYRPSTRHYEFIWTRDRRCRTPGCTTRAAWADLDHVIAHACGGATSCENLCCLCRRHHRLKTLAPGWTTRLDPDGTYTVTTPTGITRTTRPPGKLAAAAERAARAGPDEPPERGDPSEPGDPPEPDEDPPPF